jgi:hypothetical protein
VVKSG